MTIFTVYEVANTVNGRYYRGAHATENPDDGYLGSGLLIRQAVALYGREAFRRTVLAFADDEAEMYRLEAELVVTQDKDPLSYNIIPGGQLPPRPPWPTEKRKTYGRRRAERNRSAEQRASVAAAKTGRPRPDVAERNRRNTGNAIRRGFPHRPETIQALSTARKGTSHPQFGMRWITDGTLNRKVRADATAPDGWRPGRTQARTQGRFA